MAKTCNFKTAEASTKAWFRSKKIIDRYLNIRNGKLNDFRIANRQFSEYAHQTHGILGKLFEEVNEGAVAKPNTEMFRRIDAAKGKLYPENRKYARVFDNDYTLTPEDMVNKYIIPTNDGSSIMFKQPVDFAEEEALKIRIGVTNIYSDIAITTLPTRTVNGTQRYSMSFRRRSPQTIGVNTSIDGRGYDEIYDTTEQLLVQETIKPLLKKFKGVEVKWVSQKEMDKLAKEAGKVLVALDSAVTGLAIKNVVYLVKGKVTAATALEEMLHLFVDTLNAERPALYQGLINSAKLKYPGMAARVEHEYSDARGFSQDERNIEVVTRALRNAYLDERRENPEGRTADEFIKLAREFFKWFVNKLRDLYDMIIDQPRADLSNIPLRATIGDLAAYLNVTDVTFVGMQTVAPRFNISNAESEEFDAERYDASTTPEGKDSAEHLKDKKIKRTQDQIERLENLKEKIKIINKKPVTKGQFSNILETLDKFIINTQEYLEIIKSDESTISTTKFVGSPEFDDAFQKTWKPFQDFGTFIHLFLENLQLDAIELGRTPLQILMDDPDYIKNFFEDSEEKSKYAKLLSLKGVKNNKVVDKIPYEVLAKDLINIVGIINKPFIDGEVVIPELTIYSRDSEGTPVVGRLDYIILRKDGSVAVKDFKTTRIALPINDYSDVSLRKTYSTKSLVEGVHPTFQRFTYRNKVSGWVAQLGAYRRMLSSMGIDSKGDSIISIIYGPNYEIQENEEIWAYENMFVRELPLEGALIMDPDPNNRELYTQVLDALRVALPVEGEDTISDAEQKIIQDREYLSTIPVDKMRLIIEALKDRIDAQLSDANAEVNRLYKEGADDSVINEAKKRVRLIGEAKIWFDRTMIVEGEEKALPEEMVLKGLIDKTIELINDYTNYSEKISGSTNINEKIGVLSDMNKRLAHLKDFLDNVKTALLNVPTIAEDNPLVISINVAIDRATKGQGVYISVAGEQFVKAILSLPQKNVQEMMRQMEMYYEIEIPRLEKIIAGDSSVFDKGSFWLAGKVRKIFGKSTPSKNITQDMKDAAAAKLKRIKYFLSKKEFNEDFVKEYVENTFQNPESGFYIGSTIQSGFGALTGDDFRASYGNSELAITAMANYAIAMTQAATTNFFDRMEKIKVGKLTKAFANKFGSHQAANEAISKIVTVQDFATGEKTEYVSFRGPVAQDYKDRIDEYDYQLRAISEEISEIKKSDRPEAEKKLLLDTARAKQKEIRVKYSTWLVENSETKLVPELYLLEAQIPEDIKDLIDAKNTEIMTIKAKSNDLDFMLDDSSLLEIERLEFEIAELRKKARLENAELEDVFELMDKYYRWDVNEAKFEYARQQILKKGYTEDSAEYKKWLELNSDVVPDQAWVDELRELKEAKRAIFGEDDVLTELFEARSNLMAKYRFVSRFSTKSIFNPLYMNDEDYDAFTEIEAQIEDRYAQLSEVAGEVFKGMDKSLKDELKEINRRISSMRQSKNKPEYTRQLTQRINDIRKTIKLRDEETDPAQKNALARQVEVKDIEFKKWYDRNNVKEYKPGTIERGGKIDTAPTPFNTIEVPTDPKLMVRVPNSKYRTRSYKEEAYNPNYSPMLERKRYARDNYPMPKGVVYDNATGRFTVDPTARWVDPLYLEMLKDPEVKDFYEKYVLDEYYNKQVNMSANKLGFIYPGVTQSSFDTLMTDGIEGVKREAREWISNNVLLGNSEIEIQENNYGIAGRQRIRFSHNYKLPASMGTKDGIEAIMKWGLQYEIYNAMEQANLVISPAIEYLEYIKGEIPSDNQIAQQQVDKVVDILKYERDKFIYGQTFVTPGDTESSWNTQKLMRQFMTAVSWGRLAFDPAMQMGNLLSGNVQMFLSMQMEDGGNGTWKDWAFAKSQMYGRDGFMYNVIADWGKVDDVSLATKILRFFNPSMRDLSEVLDLGNRNRMRRLLNRGFAIQDLAYVIQDKGEMEIAMSTLLKNLSAHKFFVYEMNPDGTKVVDAQGNPVFKKDELGNNITVNAYEALVDNGSATPGFRADVAIDQSDLDAIRSRTQQEYMQMQGNYASWTQPKIASTMWGALLLYYRKYLEPFIENRFKGAFGVGDPKNWAAGQAQIGWWTAFGRIIRNAGPSKALYALLPGFISDKMNIEGVNPYYRAKAAQLRRELTYATIAMFAYTALRSLRYGDDDEKEELTWAQMQAMRVLAKVSNESRSMVWIPPIGRADDFIQNFATFTTAFNEGKTLVKMTENLGYYMAYETFDSETAFDRGYYQIRSYRFEAGDPKVLANIYSLTGIENVLDVINPEYSVSKLYKKKD
jgi:hypothetical protein